MRAVVLCALVAAGLARPAFAADPSPQPPSVVFGDLYRAVELAQVFPDQKTFADAIPTSPPVAILAAYRAQQGQPGFDLKAFVAAHFREPLLKTVAYRRRPGETVSDYIADLWPLLQREPDETERYSSLLPLPAPYIVPGGRFSEIYYWDTYFTMLGLEQGGRTALAADMVRNIASLITRYGHMPNGNRSYYLSRSQPPFFSCMVDLLARQAGTGVYATYLSAMRAEYDFWMAGADRLAPGQAYRRVVKLPDGTVLNRDWDDRDTPRDESYLEDIETAKLAHRPPAEVFRDLRAGAESGWDYSTRWLADGRTLATIHTTALLSVDLNSELFHLESALAYAYGLQGDRKQAALFLQRAVTRAAAIRRLMWDAAAGDFTDYDWQDRHQTHVLSAATVVPLFFHVATPAEAQAVAATVRAQLLEPGGLRTTTVVTGQQWDAPNGWAPLQWMAIQGFRNYEETDLARTIAERWGQRVNAGFADAGVLVEKYDVQAPPGHTAAGSGGEYAVQIGFGWTNGVQAALMAAYPEVKAATALSP